MHAFILAGGFATRLWPLTEKRSKPLLPLAGKPLITHLVEKLPASMPVTVSTNAAFEDGFRAWEKELPRRNIELIVEGTVQDDHKLGALGALALWVTSEKIEDDVLVLTGDNYLGFPMDDFLTAYTEGTPLLAAHDIGDKAKASAFGTVILDPMDETRIAAFEEKPKEPKTTLVSAGCAILPKATLPILLEYAKEHPDNVGGIFEEFLRRHVPVQCFVFREPWMDIGSFASYLEAHRLLVTTPQIDPDARVEETELYGAVVIAKGCVIRGSSLQDCMIFGGTTIDHCTLRDCVIDEGCMLCGIDLTGKMIRAGTTLEVTNGK